MSKTVCVLATVLWFGTGSTSYIKGFVDVYRTLAPLTPLPPLTITGLTDDEKRSLDGGLKFARGLSGMGSELVVTGVNNASDVAHHGLQSVLHFAERAIIESSKLAAHGLDILDEIEKKAPHYAGTIRYALPLIGSRSISEIRSDVSSLHLKIIPALKQVVGNTHILVDKVSQFFQHIVKITNDIMQIALCLAKMTVTGDIGDIEMYEKDLMLRTTGIIHPGGTDISNAVQVGTILNSAEKYGDAKYLSWGDSKMSSGKPKDGGAVINDGGIPAGRALERATKLEDPKEKATPVVIGAYPKADNTPDGNSTVKEETTTKAENNRPAGKPDGPGKRWSLFGMVANAVKKTAITIKNAVIGGPTTEAGPAQNATFPNSSEHFTSARSEDAGMEISDTETNKANHIDSSSALERPIADSDLDQVIATTTVSGSDNEEGSGNTNVMKSTDSAEQEIPVHQESLKKIARVNDTELLLVTKPVETSSDSDNDTHSQEHFTKKAKNDSSSHVLTPTEKSALPDAQVDPHIKELAIASDRNATVPNNIDSPDNNPLGAQTAIEPQPQLTDRTNEGVTVANSDSRRKNSYFGRFVQIVGHVANKAVKAVTGIVAPAGAKFAGDLAQNVSKAVTDSFTPEDTTLEELANITMATGLLDGEDPRPASKIPGSLRDEEAEEHTQPRRSSETLTHVTDALKNSESATEVEEQLIRIVDQATPGFESDSPPGAGSGERGPFDSTNHAKHISAMTDHVVSYNLAGTASTTEGQLSGIQGSDDAVHVKNTKNLTEKGDERPVNSGIPEASLPGGLMVGSTTEERDSKEVRTDGSSGATSTVKSDAGESKSISGALGLGMENTPGTHKPAGIMQNGSASSELVLSLPTGGNKMLNSSENEPSASGHDTGDDHIPVDLTPNIISANNSAASPDHSGLVVAEHDPLNSPESTITGAPAPGSEDKLMFADVNSEVTTTIRTTTDPPELNYGSRPEENNVLNSPGSFVPRTLGLDIESSGRHLATTNTKAPATLNGLDLPGGNAQLLEKLANKAGTIILETVAPEKVANNVTKAVFRSTAPKGQRFVLDLTSGISSIAKGVSTDGANAEGTSGAIDVANTSPIPIISGGGENTAHPSSAENKKPQIQLADNNPKSNNPIRVPKAKGGWIPVNIVDSEHGIFFTPGGT